MTYGSDGTVIDINGSSSGYVDIRRNVYAPSVRLGTNDTFPLMRPNATINTQMDLVSSGLNITYNDGGTPRQIINTSYTKTGDPAFVSGLSDQTNIINTDINGNIYTNIRHKRYYDDGLASIVLYSDEACTIEKGTYVLTSDSVHQSGEMFKFPVGGYYKILGMNPAEPVTVSAGDHAYRFEKSILNNMFETGAHKHTFGDIIGIEGDSINGVIKEEVKNILDGTFATDNELSEAINRKIGEATIAVPFVDYSELKLFSQGFIRDIGHTRVLCFRDLHADIFGGLASYNDYISDDLFGISTGWNTSLINYLETNHTSTTEHLYYPLDSTNDLLDLYHRWRTLHYNGATYTVIPSVEVVSVCGAKELIDVPSDMSFNVTYPPLACLYGTKYLMVNQFDASAYVYDPTLPVADRKWIKVSNVKNASFQMTQLKMISSSDRVVIAYSRGGSLEMSQLYVGSNNWDVNLGGNVAELTVPIDNDTVDVGSKILGAASSDGSLVGIITRGDEGSGSVNNFFGIATVTNVVTRYACSGDAVFDMVFCNGLTGFIIIGSSRADYNTVAAPGTWTAITGVPVCVSGSLVCYSDNFIYAVVGTAADRFSTLYVTSSTVGTGFSTSSSAMVNVGDTSGLRLGVFTTTDLATLILNNTADTSLCFSADVDMTGGVNVTGVNVPWKSFVNNRKTHGFACYLGPTSTMYVDGKGRIGFYQRTTSREIPVRNYSTSSVVAFDHGSGANTSMWRGLRGLNAVTQYVEDGNLANANMIPMGLVGIDTKIFEWYLTKEDINVFVLVLSDIADGETEPFPSIVIAPEYRFKYPIIAFDSASEEMKIADGFGDTTKFFRFETWGAGPESFVVNTPETGSIKMQTFRFEAHSNVTAVSGSYAGYVKNIIDLSNVITTIDLEKTSLTTEIAQFMTVIFNAAAVSGLVGSTARFNFNEVIILEDPVGGSTVNGRLTETSFEFLVNYVRTINGYADNSKVIVMRAVNGVPSTIDNGTIACQLYTGKTIEEVVANYYLSVM